MSSAHPLGFRKMNGLGNEILVVDLRGTGRTLTSGRAAAIAADPRTRFDQLMALTDARTAGTEAYIEIFNTDGSPAGACGNGMRCVGWSVAAETGKSQLRFETRAGLLDVTVTGIDHITVDMGQPRFRWNEIPLRDEFFDTTRIELQIGPIDAPILHSPSVVSMGNPHAIFWVEDVEAFDLGRFGPLLEHHPIFPEGANISLAHVTSPQAITLKTWERGAGLTRACGSAACAAAVAAARLRLTERRVVVRVPGGPLVIEWTAGDRVLMTGPAEHEYDGVLDAV